MKLNVKAFGLACGIMWAIVMAWAILMNMFAISPAPFELFKGFYLGWLSLTPVGIIFSIVLGFVDGFVAGVIFSWLYNKIAKA